MALRVLSGLVNIRSSGPKSGSVRIGFNPHQRTQGTVGVVERATVGPAGRFVAVPAKIIALRQITLLGIGPMPDYKFRLADTISRDSIRIRWSGVGPAFSEEVSYMIIGEVPDPQPSRAPVRRPSRPSRPKRPPRRPRRPRG
jgi:hypothetical protein